MILVVLITPGNCRANHALTYTAVGTKDTVSRHMNQFIEKPALMSRFNLSRVRPSGSLEKLEQRSIKRALSKRPICARLSAFFVIS